MLNEDVIDLYARVNVGTKVVVMPMHPGRGPSVVQDSISPRNAKRCRQRCSGTRS